MADEYDPFETTTGLPDRLSVQILESWFEYPSDYMDGQQLVIKFKVHSDDDDFNAAEKDLMYSVGKGWTVEDRGARAVRDDGSPKGFNDSTAYALFFKAAIGCDGAENDLRSEGRGDPRLAAMWVDTCWFLERKTRDYGGTIGEISRLIPTKYLGTKGINSTEANAVKASGPTAKAAPAKAAAPTKAAGPVAKAPAKATGPVKKATAPTPAAAEENGAGVFDENHPLYETLYAVAMEAEDHEAFMETAFSTIAGVSDDKVVGDAVMDGGEGSLWAKVVADYQAQQGG